MFNKALHMVGSRLQISYILINQYEDLRDIGFLHSSLSKIQWMPKDCLQLFDQENFFRFSVSNALDTGPHIFLLSDDMLKSIPEPSSLGVLKYINTFFNSIVKVFIIDEKIINNEIFSTLLSSEKFSYYCTISQTSEQVEDPLGTGNYFAESSELIKLIEGRLEEISHILESELDIKIDVPTNKNNSKLSQQNLKIKTDICETNFHTINQIISNFPYDKAFLPEAGNDFSLSSKRVELQISQVETIDTYFSNLQDNRPVTPIQQKKNPLIIIAPYHFPDNKEHRKNRSLSKREKASNRISKSEQTLDYTFTTYPNDVDVVGKEMAQEIIIREVFMKLLMIDKIAYLHASLKYSPVIRFPLVGATINADLSHILSDFPAKKNAIRKILKLGERLAELLVDPNFQSLILERDGQIVFISDLPMEWLKLAKYPLFLSHDICRIPERNYASLMNNYMANQRFKFSIGSDILEHTLVLHCASRSDQTMHRSFATIDSLKPSLGFKSEICYTIQEIVDAIRTHQPQLLILDSHGGYDQQKQESFLIIDQDQHIYLRGEDIIREDISAPIVFISACSTMPSFGFKKFLTDAFFQTGSFCVTATFLPILIKDATVLLVRILNNLKQHESTIIHNNWLSFLSHTLRGVLLFETIRKFEEKFPNAHKISPDIKSQWLTELMVFDKRKDIFDRLLQYLQKLNPTTSISFDDLNNEWLSYTTIGRADLIYFGNWLAEHRRLNSIGII